VRNQWSDDARKYRAGAYPRSFLGGDPNVIAFLVSKGMSKTDASFIADYEPINKDQLTALLNSGTAPYDALTQMYGGAPYIPNLDSPPLDNYRPPSYAPLPGYPKTLAATGDLDGLPTEVSALDVIVSKKVGGIPIVYIVAAGVAALLLSR
jgi:hypothetical protein